jgi:hypothetical protein
MQNLTDHVPPRFRRLGLRTAIAALAVAAASVIGVAAQPDPTPAEAWPWDPHVQLNGRISCPAWGGPYDKVQWAWVVGNGENSWARLGTGGTTRPYAKDFWRIPYGRSVLVHVRYGCAATGADDAWFYLSRPTTGIYATRNIY